MEGRSIDVCVCVSKGYNILLQNISRIISLEKSSD